MLTNPFIGKELFAHYESAMCRIAFDNSDEEWEAIGKTKKAAWNNLAKIINERMRNEAIQNDHSAQKD